MCASAKLLRVCCARSSRHSSGRWPVRCRQLLSRGAAGALSGSSRIIWCVRCRQTFLSPVERCQRAPPRSDAGAPQTRELCVLCQSLAPVLLKYWGFWFLDEARLWKICNWQLALANLMPGCDIDYEPRILIQTPQLCACGPSRAGCRFSNHSVG